MSSELKSTPLPEHRCPACSRLTDTATGVEPGTTPSEGDLSVCFGCRAFLTFNPDLTLRLLSLLEIAQLPDATRIQMQRARAYFERIDIEGGGSSGTRDPGARR